MKTPSPFGHSSFDEGTIEKWREQAMQAEVRRLLRVEARAKLQESVRAAIEEAGGTVEEIIEPEKTPPTGVEVAAAAVAVVLDTPRILFALFCYGVVLWLLFVVLYFTWVK